MKKDLFVVIAAFAALFTISCNKEEAAIEDVKVGGPVTITANVPEHVTKVAGAYDGSKLVLTWQETDAITVANAADPSKSVVFSYVSGAGTKTGSFSAADASALEGATRFNVSCGGLPGSLATQTQSVDGSTEHVQYSVALNGVDAYKEVSFTPAWAAAHGGTIAQSGALHLHATLPAGVAAVVNSVNIKAGAYSVTVALSTQADTDSDEALDVFATLPATNTVLAAGTELFVKFGTTTPEHDVYTRYYAIPSDLTLQTGQLNLINLTCTNTDKYAGKDDDGTAAHPYLIADKYQMAAMADLLVADEKTYFKMVDDITVSSWTSLNSGNNSAIDLDGNGKTISGLNKPLFAFLNGKVENLNIDGASISVSSGQYYGVLVRSILVGGCEISNVHVSNSTLKGASYLGGLIGRIETTASCTVTDCSTDVALSGSDYYHGGLVGYVKVANGTFTGCSATGNVTNTRDEKYGFAGGLIGYVDGGTISITKCNYSTGTISTTAPSGAVGGLLGFVKASVAISKSFFNGTVSGPQYLGGIIGDIDPGSVSITDCYVSGSIAGTGNYCGGFLGVFNASTTVTVTNGYTNASVAGGKWSACVFGGGNSSSDYTKLTCTGVVEWNTSSRVAWCYNVSAAPAGNYMGTEGTIYSQAVALGGWDFENVWTTDATPKLK